MAYKVFSAAIQSSVASEDLENVWRLIFDGRNTTDDKNSDAGEGRKNKE